jgi:hypothetical protein
LADLSSGLDSIQCWESDVEKNQVRFLGGGHGRLRQRENRVEVYAIKVTLLGTSPPVWRRILVPREITLRTLHRSLQTVMGWTNSHLHQFVCQRPRSSPQGSGVGSKIADENRTKLGKLIGTVGARLLYEYDFGESPLHQLRPKLGL